MMKSLMDQIRGMLPKSIDLEIFTDKLGESARRVIRLAYEEARANDHNKLCSEHVLLAFTKSEPALFGDLMRSLNLDAKVIVENISAQLRRTEYKGHGIMESDGFRHLLSNAVKRARKRSGGRMKAESGDLIVALFEDTNSYPAKLFRSLGVAEDEVIRHLEMLVSA
jgi:ATP-dependent Clp protease ATP-binding subunit ClpA